ncbi:MAG: DUF1697 domain-containing protein [Chitinophagales bacterium]|nr:DUF1697 domain-containing protein [Chitinophagales bacterium]
MQTYISILRGINVSGHKQIKMADLKVLYEGLKFKDVSTYIQSGNIVFKAASTSDTEISAKIGQAILKKYQFEVPVIIRTAQEMETIYAANPFINQKDIDQEKLHVTFLARMPEQVNLDKIENLSYASDQFTLLNREVYLYCPGGYGNTKLSNTFFENKLKVTATTRNWKTVTKLIAIADQISG